MTEKILGTKKNGMLVLVVTTLLYMAAVAGCIAGGFIMDDKGSPVPVSYTHLDVYKRQVSTGWSTKHQGRSFTTAGKCGMSRRK